MSRTTNLAMVRFWPGSKPKATVWYRCHDYPCHSHLASVKPNFRPVLTVLHLQLWLIHMLFLDPMAPPHHYSQVFMDLLCCQLYPMGINVTLISPIFESLRKYHCWIHSLHCKDPSTVWCFWDAILCSKLCHPYAFHTVFLLLVDQSPEVPFHDRIYPFRRSECGELLTSFVQCPNNNTTAIKILRQTEVLNPEPVGECVPFLVKSTQPTQ